MAPFVAPPVFDFWAQKVNRTLSWERPLARVVGRRVTARGVVTLQLRANRHFRGFQAGQHVPVSVEVDGVRMTRTYSPVTPWRADGRLSITVKAVAGGKVSNALLHDVAVGDVLELGPAFGDMVLPADAASRRWLLVAGGSGITPLMCLLRALLAENPEADITLMQWARELLPTEQTGRPDDALFRAQMPDLGNRSVRACGPWGFVDAVRSLLAGHCADFASESFTPPPANVSAGEAVTVTLALSGRQLQVPSGVPLLESLEAAGLQPEHGCRMGVCNTCVCNKRDGSTEHVHSARRDDEAGPVRLCVSAPRSDITLEL
ncbi:NADPH oxidoreductase (Stearoyl-CoA 9-desaturase electron transfer partner) [Durusdinium trenchii]|uniref:NADPH oxidoreductase (Stearoyl-CoA 9-desaturase electron transfer partner) n=1 Tax=Durusdinium trenchii TaxID=1381693 RepID=A0ABP0NH17_9DINO